MPCIRRLVEYAIGKSGHSGDFCLAHSSCAIWDEDKAQITTQKVLRLDSKGDAASEADKQLAIVAKDKGVGGETNETGYGRGVHHRQTPEQVTMFTVMLDWSQGIPYDSAGAAVEV